MSSGLWRPPDERVRRPDGGTAPHKDRGIGSSAGDGASSPSAAAAQPRRMTLRSFHALKRNTLVGFAAITLPVGQFDLELDEITLHQLASYRRILVTAKEFRRRRFGSERMPD